jgi:hypothetical protein
MNHCCQLKMKASVEAALNATLQKKDALIA